MRWRFLARTLVILLAIRSPDTSPDGSAFTTNRGMCRLFG